MTVNYVRYDADPTDAVMAAKKPDAAILFCRDHPTCDAGWGHCYDPSEGKERIDRKTINLNPIACTGCRKGILPHGDGSGVAFPVRH